MLVREVWPDPDLVSSIGARIVVKQVWHSGSKVASGCGIKSVEVRRRKAHSIDQVLVGFTHSEERNGGLTPVEVEIESVGCSVEREGAMQLRIGGIGELMRPSLLIEHKIKNENELTEGIHIPK